ncbi:MAG TPA: hypothetical protein VFW82_02610 [Dyella sp.]|nr:hypothetical protein [Dyella sp.]
MLRAPSPQADCLRGTLRAPRIAGCANLLAQRRQRDVARITCRFERTGTASIVPARGGEIAAPRVVMDRRRKIDGTKKREPCGSLFFIVCDRTD